MNAVRRRRLRLVLRDLAAASAFCAMVISGQVPVWTLAVFVAGLVLALMDARLLANRAVISGAALAATAVGLGLAVVGGGFDPVVAACAFAGVITVQRLLSEPTPATDGQVHLTSLLMIAGGAALSGELLFAVCLVVFTALASLSLGLGVAESALGAGEELPMRPLLRQLLSALAVAVALSLAFFILFPRLSWNVAARRVSPGLGATPQAGMSDRVTLGGNGNIKRNPRIVARIQLDPDPGREFLDEYWVGHVYDTFDGADWKGSGTSRRPRPTVELLPSAKHLVSQRIELLPAYGSQTLVGLWPVVLFGNAVAHSPGASARTRLVAVSGEEVRFESQGLGYSYYAYSLPPRSGDRSALEETKDLQLPATLDPRVGELAAKIVGADRSPLRAANALAAYLKSNYRYSLELSGDVADPLAEFLFTRKQGHCEHFATALAVMLRTLGIPARVAGGFYGGERVGGQYVLRAGDAHAWTQVYVRGTGFVTVDATPEEARPARPAVILEWLTRQYEALDALWRARVVDYSIVDQFQLASRLVRPPGRHGAEGDPLPWSKGAWAVAALAAAWLLIRVFRAMRRRPVTAEATALLDAAEKLLRGAHVQHPAEQLEELAVRLEATAHPLARSVNRLARRYVEARFGNRPLQPEEARHLTRALQKEVAQRANPPGHSPAG